MENIKKPAKRDYALLAIIAIMLAISVLVLRSIASTLFPLYFLYFILGIGAFFLFSSIDFDVVSIFSKHLYIFSIVLLILPLIIGQVTRGAIRWIPIGPLTIQPAEIVRPFLLVFFANYLTEKEVDSKRLLRAVGLLALPAFLILIQPSLGVTVLTIVAFVGVTLAANINKKYYLIGGLVLALLIPSSYFLLHDYQKSRIVSFLYPEQDPSGAGYNSIQSMISVGSGGLFGKGLGKGVQTQLAFLPEKHSDFIFAAVSEELGFVGAAVLLAVTFAFLLKLIKMLENANSRTGRAFMAGFFLTIFAQVIIHIGMNMGMFPITGLPYPLVSAGGSSLLATMTGLGIAVSTRRNKSIR